MACEVVDLYLGGGEGKAAEERFFVVHRDRAFPGEVEELKLSVDWDRGGTFWLARVLSGSGLASNKSSARRLIEQGGVRLDGSPVTDPDAEFTREELIGRVLQVGRRRFVRLR